MKWILKAIIQKVISGLPASQKVNFLFQKYVTRGVQLTETHFGDKLTAAQDHLRYFHKYGNSVGLRALELGSGWYPVVPVALFLAGFQKVLSIDISPLMKEQGIRQTIECYLEYYDAGRLGEMEAFIKPDRLEALRKMAQEPGDKEALLKRLQLELRICDARQTGYADDSFDLICSNNTYEHVDATVLRGIIGEFQRMLKPGGVNSHFIDMSDHFAHLDSSITIYNYLRYSPRQWRIIDNSVQPQNRLRLSDYHRLYKEHGISVLHQDRRPGRPEALDNLRLAPPYDRYRREDIAVSHVHLVSSK